MKNRMINYTLVLTFLSGCHPSKQQMSAFDSAPLAGLTGENSAGPSNLSKDEALRMIINNSSLPLKSKELLAQSAPGQFHSNGTSDITALGMAQYAFTAEQQRIASNSQILNYSKNGLNYVLTATKLGASLAGVTAPAAVAIEIANQTLTKSLEYGISELETSSKNEAARILANKLKFASAKELKSFDALRSLPPERALKEAEKMVNNWFPEEKLKNLPADMRAEARSITSHWVARSAIAKLAEFKSAQEIVNKTVVGDIEKAQQDLIATGSALKAFAKETNKNIKTLTDSQNKISAGLNEISANVAKNADDLFNVADDVNFLKDFAFSRMTTSEQVKMIQESAKKRGEELSSETKKKLEILQFKADFEQGYKTYFAGAQNLVAIAKTFKVDAKLVNDISGGLEKINAVATGVQLAMAGGTGNYLAGAAAIAGLMGGGDDGSAARHQEIIMRLDKVLENQEKMTALIKQTFEIQVEMLTQISNQIRQSTEVLYTKMDTVHNDVMWNRVILSSLSLSALDSCNMAAKTISVTSFKDSMNKRNFRDHLTICSREYDRVFKLKNFAAHFSAAVYNSPKHKELFVADEKNFNDAINLLRTEFKGSYIPSMSLRNPSENAYGLLQKIGYLESSNQNPSERAIDENINAFQYRLFAPGVTKNVQKMISLYPYIALWNTRTGDSAEEIFNLRKIRPNAGSDEVETLDAALDLVNYSVQQESLMAGDLLLPMLYKKFSEIQGSNELCNSENRSPSKCLLESNDTLRQNFVIFGLYNEFYQNKTALSAYRQALRIPNDPLALVRILKNNWKISWNAGGKYVASVAGKETPLPTFEAVAEGKMIISGSLALLLRTREDLINLKAEATMNSNLALEQKDIIHSLFIKYTELR